MSQKPPIKDLHKRELCKCATDMSNKFCALSQNATTTKKSEYCSRCKYHNNKKLVCHIHYFHPNYCS